MRVSAAFVLVVAGCADEVVRVAPPALEGAATALLAIRQGSSVSLRAAPADELGIVFDAAEEAQATLQVAAYAEPLEDLGLSRDLIVSATGERAELLPNPIAVWEAERVGASWMQSTAWPEITALRTIRPSRNSPCTTFTVTTAAIEGVRTFPAASALLPDGRVLVTFEQTSDYLIIDATGAATTVTSTHAPRSALFAAGDGTLWLGSDTGEIWRGTLAGTELSQRIVVATEDGAIFRLERGSRPNEVYSLSTTGVLGLVHGGTFEVVHDFRGTPRAKGDVLATSWGTVAVRGTAILELRDRMSELRGLLELGGELASLVESPALGIVLGGRGLARMAGERLEVLTFGEDRLIALVVSMLADEDRLLYLDNGGRLEEYVAGYGRCPPVVSFNVSGHRLFRTQGIVLAIGDPGGTSRLPVFILRAGSGPWSD